MRTERLLLRPPWPEDGPALFQAIADEAIVRNLASAPWPYLPEHAQAFVLRERGPEAHVCLILRRTEAAPEPIGAIGIDPGPDGEPELGYWIARDHWGRGYAAEAGRAVLALARDGLRLRRLSAGHFLDNPASGRVLAKLGFRPTGRIVPRISAGRGATAPCRLYSLDLGAEEEHGGAAMAA